MQNVAKNLPVYVCEKCCYGTNKASDFQKHCLTRKHTMDAFAATTDYICRCGKTYKYRQGIYKHKMTCTVWTNETITDKDDGQNDAFVSMVQSHEKIQMMTMTMLQQLHEQNSSLQKQLATLCNTVYINSNCNNKTFNLQVFLNEDCKDAMNMSDFINSVQLQLSDLESVGELGYVDGISTIFLQKLNELDVYKRPIHCTVVKRHVIHIKDADEWTRDDNHTQFKHAIKRLSKKNSDLLMDWKERHPGSQDAHHRQNGQFLNMIIQSMGGPSNTSIDDSECKIIKRVSKGITVEKSIY